jgi:FAD:protein FMN transferase
MKQERKDLNYDLKYAASFLVVAICLVSACSSHKDETYKKTKTLMDTFVTVTVVSDSAEKAEDAIEKAFSTMEHFGDLVNFFSDTSEIAEINRKAGISPVKVSPETIEVIDKAVFVASKSGGAFDPTIGPVMKLWDFHKNIRPSDEDIRSKLKLVDYRKIVTDKQNSTVYLNDKGMMLDPGGIAKGYAADLAVKTLGEQGIRAGVVAAAGDIRTFGMRPDGKPWNIGIKNPRPKNGSDDILATVRLGDKAISTSGDYERFFIRDGQRYHHILDPKTGYPAGGCRSVTVITDRGVFTDAFSTAVFVLGPEKGLKLARDEEMETLIVDAAGKIVATPGLQDKLKFEKSD